MQAQFEEVLLQNRPGSMIQYGDKKRRIKGKKEKRMAIDGEK